MKKTKRFLAWLLTMAMLISVLPANLFADELVQAEPVMTEEVPAAEEPQENPDLYGEGFEAGDEYADPAPQGDFSYEDPAYTDQGEIPSEGTDTFDEDYLDEEQEYSDNAAPAEEAADYQEYEDIFTEEAPLLAAQGADADTAEGTEESGTEETPDETVPAAEKFAWAGTEVTFVYEDGTIPASLAPQEGTTAVIAGNDIVIHYVPYDTVSYACF